MSKILFFLMAFGWMNEAFCQYSGGSGKGDNSISLNAVSLAGIGLQMLYGGGKGQGSTVANVFANGLDGTALVAMYVGSEGKGDTQAGLFAQTLAGENMNVLFVGGAGRGDRFGTKNSYALGGEAVDLIYYGGAGRGDTSLRSMQITLFDCTLQNMWNGKVSTAWEEVANWTCNELPGLNSVVLITSGVTRFPVINVSTEIRQIQIESGASLTVKAGYQLKLNGQ